MTAQAFGRGGGPATGDASAAGSQHSPVSRSRAVVERSLADRLPRRARTKFLGLRRAAADALALLQPVEEELSAARAERRQFDFATDYEQDRFRGGSPLPFPEAEQKRRDDKAAKIAALDARIADLKALADERRGAWQAVAETVSRIETYAGRVSAGVLADHADEPIALRKGQSPEAALTKVRDEIAQLFADLHEIESAAIPANEVKQIVRAHVARLADRGQPVSHQVLDGIDQITWPKIVSHQIVELPNGGGAAVVAIEVTDVEATLAWLFPGEMAKRLEDDLAAMSDGITLTYEERRERKAVALDKLLAAERAEEHFVCQVPGAARRPNADPRAVLGIDGPAPRDN